MQKIKEDEILVKIKEDLPTLPTVVTRILNIVLDEKSSVKDISKVVRLDQALSSRVLRIVNSAAFGLRSQVSTLDHAMAVLGFDTLKKLFLSVSIFDNLSQENQAGYFFNKSHFWCHSLAVATVAKCIAHRKGYRSPDEAYVAGLLHDVGKIIIEQTMGTEYINYMKNLNLNPTMSLRFEEENLSVNHAAVGRLAFEKWNLPVPLQKAVEFHHGTENSHEDIDDLAAIISVADFICWTQALGSFNFFYHPTLNPQIGKIVNLDDLKVEPILEEMNKDLSLNAKIFNFQVTDLKGFREALQRANFELGRINSLYDDTRKKLEKHIQELNTLNDIIYKAREKMEPLLIIKNALQGIQEGFGFTRLIWFSVDPEGKTLIPKEIYGEFQDNVPITSTGCKWDEKICLPISDCIQNKKIFHIKYPDDTIPSDPTLFESLQTDELLLVPISTDKKIKDLILIDNPKGTVFVSTDTIKVLDILAVNLGMALENARLFEQTAHMAIIDPLTDIYNRRQLDSALTNEINRAIRFQQPFCIAIFDIDLFKTINDNYGHQSGDVVLKDIAGIIKSNSRNIDIVGRMGGDEFLVILPNTQLQGAFTFGERVRLVVEKYDNIRQKNFPKCQISISVGVAGFDVIDTPERLLHKADKALYRSKKRGRNKVSPFEG